MLTGFKCNISWFGRNRERLGSGVVNEIALPEGCDRGVWSAGMIAQKAGLKPGEKFVLEDCAYELFEHGFANMLLAEIATIDSE